MTAQPLTTRWSIGAKFTVLAVVLVSFTALVSGPLARLLHPGLHVITLGAVIALAVLAARRILAPLRALADAAAVEPLDDRLARCVDDGTADGELRDLARSIAALHERLRAYRVKINEQNAILKERQDGPPSVSEALRTEMDLTRAAGESYRMSERLFRVLIDHSREIIVTLDRTGTLTYASPVATRTLGLDPAAFIGTPIFDLVHPDDAPGIIGEFAVLVGESGGSRHDLCVRARHADGSWVPLTVNAANLLDEPGVNVVVVTAREVTSPAT